MSAISNFLSFLRSAIYAIDVRDGIADAIEQCYSDVSNPTLKTEALEAALQTKIDEGEMAALTIGDGTITAAKLASGVIDNTLVTPGAAADAKKTGDEITAIKADLDAMEGLTDDIKEALLACFDNVAWKGEEGNAAKEALEEALYSNRYYEQEEWKLSTNALGKRNGTIVSYTGYGPAINSAGTYRRAFYAKKGLKPFADYSDGSQIDGVYPIPVPTGYNKAVVTITPNTQYINLATRSLIDGQYSAAAVNFVDYAQGTNAIDITVPETGRMFLSVTSKYDNAGTSYPTEPTELTVKFSKEV